MSTILLIIQMYELIHRRVFHLKHVVLCTMRSVLTYIGFGHLVYRVDPRGIPRSPVVYHANSWHTTQIHAGMEYHIFMISPRSTLWVIYENLKSTGARDGNLMINHRIKACQTGNGPTFQISALPAKNR